jgi:hypothetical protein
MMTEDDFADWSFDEWVSGAKCLLDVDVDTQNPPIESTIALLDKIRQILDNNYPDANHPMKRLLAKLVAWRLGIKLAQSDRDFDPTVWMRRAAEDQPATGADGQPATGAQSTSWDASAPKLKQALIDFIKNTPRGTVLPDWLVDFKRHLKYLTAPKQDKAPEGEVKQDPPTAPEGEAQQAAATTPEGEVAQPATSGITPAIATDGSTPALAAGGSAPAIATEGTIDPINVIKVGDHIIGMAKKKQHMYDQVRCQVVAVLAQHYKVELLEGPEKGAMHKYLHDMVRIDQVGQGADDTLAATSATLAATDATLVATGTEMSAASGAVGAAPKDGSDGQAPAAAKKNSVADWWGDDDSGAVGVASKAVVGEASPVGCPTMTKVDELWGNTEF